MEDRGNRITGNYSDVCIHIKKIGREVLRYFGNYD